MKIKTKTTERENLLSVTIGLMDILEPVGGRYIVTQDVFRSNGNGPDYLIPYVLRGQRIEGDQLFEMLDAYKMGRLYLRC